MDPDYTYEFAAAEVTQVGDVFRAVFTLPLKVGGKHRQITVEGVGEHIRVAVDDKDPEPVLGAFGLGA